MDTLLWIVSTTFMISLFALVGVFTFSLRHQLLEKIIMFLVALSAGALMGGAFLHLIPEAVESFDNGNLFIYILVGFAIFFLVEKLLHWRHCHKEKCEIHTFAYMNLFGDFVHNFIDGLIIAASFAINTAFGLTTVLAIALHEIPQEIGDFGVLIHGGIKKGKALLLNFAVALTVVLGGIVGYFLLAYVEAIKFALIPFAAGGFIYIAASDLIPEIRKEPNLLKSMATFAVFIFGILIMFGLKAFGG